MASKYAKPIQYLNNIIYLDRVMFAKPVESLPKWV